MSVPNIFNLGIGRRKLLVSTVSAATLAMLGALPALAKPSREIARTPVSYTHLMLPTNREV